ncbi:tRNA-dihydrouridine(16/17) synthase [NAD(P)(+)]-like [Oscarella lobularis]|uniref:tRNA-dihydrouridine(16/17) synthase [NAD(P)(+)]-like n=1 Tax=Oscarella lobularis TaxID=121494 RepID=UPI003313E21D
MAKTKPVGYEFWRSVLREAKYVMAPMVDQSELAWRLLGRRYGIDLCYTPMLHAGVFSRDVNYRRESLVTCPEDRPLIVQFCGNDPDVVLAAARLAEPHCDAIDLNLGCPQSVAKRGRYGAFLQDDWDLVYRIVSTLHTNLSIPVTCKVRIFPEIEKSVRYAQMLERAGCQLLTVHGRTREQRGVDTGLANWEHVREMKSNVSIPVFSNGNVQYLHDVTKCLEETKVDGIMSAEGVLYNPALFTGTFPTSWQITDEYLALVKEHPCPISFVRGHLFKVWHHVLDRYPNMRPVLAKAHNLEEIAAVCQSLKERALPDYSEGLVEDFGYDSIPYYRCQPYFRPETVRLLTGKQLIKRPLDSVEDDSRLEKKIRIRKERKLAKKESFEEKKSRGRWTACAECGKNPKGKRCEHGMCRVCCKVHCAVKVLDCVGHRLVFKTRLEGEKVLEGKAT